MTVESTGRKRGLGRGLSALITNTEAAASTGEVVEADVENGVRMVDVDVIQPNPHQPRTRFDSDALAELAASIREHGIIQPLIVARRPDAPGAYWLVAGERRWRAALLAEMKQVPVILRDGTSQQLMEWALVENLQRADLNPLEEATAYQTLVDEFGLTQAEVAERVSKSRPAVANTLRLLQLPLPVQAGVIDGRLSAGHARALLPLDSEPVILQAYEKVLSQELNVRQTEALVKQLLAQAHAGVGVTKEPPADDPQIRAQIGFLEDRFRAALGTRVSLSRNSDGSGRLVVHFFSDDELEQIYRLIASSDEPF